MPRQAVIVLAAVLVACVGPDDGSAPDGAAEPPPAEEQTPAQEPAREDDNGPAEAGDDQATAPEQPADAAVEALDFAAPTLDGARFEGRDLAGDHVVLWMWAPW